MTASFAPAIAAVTIDGASPSSVMTAGEVQGFLYSPVSDLGPEQSVLAPSVSLVDAHNGTTIAGGAALHSVPVDADGNIAMRVANVEKGRTYELRVCFLHSPPRVTGERTCRVHMVVGQ